MSANNKYSAGPRYNYGDLCAGTREKTPEGLISVDHWEEIFEGLETLGKEHIGVVRSRGNWLARLATTCVCLQKKLRVVLLLSAAFCWNCNCRKNWSWKAETVVESAIAANDLAIEELTRETQDDDSDDSEGSVGSVIHELDLGLDNDPDSLCMPQVFIM